MRNQQFITKHTKEGIERYNRQQIKRSAWLRALERAGDMKAEYA